MGRTATNAGTTGTLVVVPCGAAKVWAKRPGAGPTAARDAYTSSHFKAQRRYAEARGDRWVILSAKYGYLDPRNPIEDYDVTFHDPATGPVATDVLARQVRTLRLLDFEIIEALGGSAYRERVLVSFGWYRCADRVIFPFEGCDLFETMRAVRSALDAGTRS
jgi:hypothetical protein